MWSCGYSSGLECGLSKKKPELQPQSPPRIPQLYLENALIFGTNKFRFRCIKIVYMAFQYMFVVCNDKVIVMERYPSSTSDIVLFLNIFLFIL